MRMIHYSRTPIRGPIISLIVKTANKICMNIQTIQKKDGNRVRVSIDKRGQVKIISYS